jgi:glycopeptide antibiotics resistance protein
VIVFGAHASVSVWTLVALVAGAVLSLLLWRPLVRWRRWQPAATLASLLFLTVTLALTGTPGDPDPPMGLYACIPTDLPDLVFNIIHTGGGLVGALLNLVLMLPLTFSLVLATRRVWPGVMVAVVLPVAVELTQTVLPGHYCTISDVLTNGTGALLGVALAHWLQVRRSPPVPRGPAQSRR